MNETIRITMSEKSGSKFKKLRERTGASNNAEVFSYALTLFAWVVTEASEGRQICSMDLKTRTIRSCDINGIFKKTMKRARFIDKCFS